MPNSNDIRTTRRSGPLRKAVYYRLTRDFLIVLFSVILAIVGVQIGILEHLTLFADGAEILGSFIAGLFFTSAFTIAPAAVVLGEISTHVSPYTVAFYGAIGAMIGDLVLFLFIRDVFADDLLQAVKLSPLKKILSLSRFGIVRFLMPFIGALIIASPLPDEFGVALLGFARIRIAYLLPISFCMNYLGVLLIALLAHAL